MRVTIVFNHPFDGSYCSAILSAVTKGLQEGQHEIDLIHLDRDNFNPVMTAADLKAFRDRKPIDPKVIEYKERLEKADHLIMIFPIWWELMPALMKGFVDKVVFPGVMYDYKDARNTFMKPLMPNIRSVTMITTMNTPGWAYRLLFGNAIKKAMMLGTFWKMGYKNRKWISFNQVKTVPQEKRTKWLADLENRFANLR